MSTRITVQVDEVPEVEYNELNGLLFAGGWTFDVDEPVTAEDVAAFAAAKTWFEQHPEAIPDVG